MTESRSQLKTGGTCLKQTKPIVIKHEVEEAYKRVKANKGSNRPAKYQRL